MTDEELAELGRRYSGTFAENTELMIVDLLEHGQTPASVASLVRTAVDMNLQFEVARRLRAVLGYPRLVQTEDIELG